MIAGKDGLLRIGAVAETTYRETIRNRILLNLMGFAAVMLGVSWVVSNWSVGEPEKIVADLGLTVTNLAGVVTALFAGIVLVWGEVERRTILPVLAKPLHRWEFLAGKFLGFSAAVLLVYAGMNAMLTGLLLALNYKWNAMLWIAMGLGAMEVLVIVALALLFSTFASPALAALYTIMLFVAGRFSGDIRVFLQDNPDTPVEGVLSAVYAIIPHLGLFNLRRQAVHGLSVNGGEVGLAVGYGLLYVVMVLSVAAAVFRNRDLA